MVTTCIWEAFQGFDGYAQPSYAAPVTKECFREAHTMLQTGLEVTRLAEITTSDPDFDLFFDGDDPDTQIFTLYDRFHTGGVGIDSSGDTLQPSAISTVLGPWGSSPWLVVVSFQ